MTNYKTNHPHLHPPPPKTHSKIIKAHNWKSEIKKNKQNWKSEISKKQSTNINRIPDEEHLKRGEKGEKNSWGRKNEKKKQHCCCRIEVVVGNWVHGLHGGH